MSYTPRPDIIYQELQELRRIVRQLLTQSPLGYSSITEGSLRVASNEGLIVEGSAKIVGWFIVTGTERVTGRLEGSGTLDWTGPWALRGNGDITGDVALTGSIDVGGAGGVTIDGVAGEIRIAGTSPIRFRVVSGGAVMEIGGTTIREQDGLLAIDAGDGAGIFQDSFTLQMKQGGVAFAVGSFGPQIVGLPTTAQANYPGSFPGAVVANATGQLFRVI